MGKRVAAAVASLALAAGTVVAGAPYASAHAAPHAGKTWTGSSAPDDVYGPDHYNAERLVVGSKRLGLRTGWHVYVWTPGDKFTRRDGYTDSTAAKVCHVSGHTFGRADGPNADVTAQARRAGGKWGRKRLGYVAYDKGCQWFSVDRDARWVRFSVSVPLDGDETHIVDTWAPHR